GRRSPVGRGDPRGQGQRGPRRDRPRRVPGQRARRGRADDHGSRTAARDPLERWQGSVPRRRRREMTPRDPAAEAAGLALLEALQAQRVGFLDADGDTIRRYAEDIEARVRDLFQDRAIPLFSPELLAGLRTALEEHARLVATASARVDRGLRAMGLETTAIPGRRSIFAG